MANETGIGGDQLPCLYFIIILIVLAVFYFVVLAYQRFRSKNEVRRHMCEYCGKLVVAVSKCHLAPVRERLGSVKCTKCRHETVPVCSICRKTMNLKGH